MVEVKAISSTSVGISRSYRPDMLVHMLRRTPLNRIFPTLMSWNEKGILSKTIPGWDKIVGMQSEACHEHTVDIHSIHVVDLIAKNPDLARVDKPHLLLLAGLLHDLGKSDPERRHEEFGAEMFGPLGEKFGLSGEEISRVQWLVRQHSVMGGFYVMTDRNPNPVVRLTGLERLAQTTKRLTDLYILSFADTAETFGIGKATETLRRAYKDAYALLTYGTAPEARTDVVSERYLHEEAASISDDTDLSRTLLAQGSLFEWRVLDHSYHDSTKILKVVARANPETLWKLSAVLSRKGINIIRANVFSFKKGLYSIKFYIDSSSQDQNAILEAMRLFEGVMKGSSNIDIEAKKEGQGPYKTKVEIDNDLSRDQSALIVTTFDRPFLFSRITRVLSRHGMVHEVIATTAEDQVMDIFYFTGVDGSKITDAFELERINAEITAEI